ncbi:hypothetical protein SNK03_004475 [Fusarium graminearum]
MFDLNTLAAYTKSRNHLVKYVVLELNLDRYTWTPTPSEGCFLKTAQTLFKILSTWDGHGINLEFAILSHEEVYFTYSEDHSIYAIPRQPRAQSTFAQYKQYFELPQEMLFGSYLADSEAAWHRKVSLLVGRRSLGFLFSQFKYTQLQVPQSLLQESWMLCHVWNLCILSVGVLEHQKKMQYMIWGFRIT